MFGLFLPWATQFWDNQLLSKSQCVIDFEFQLAVCQYVRPQLILRSIKAEGGSIWCDVIKFVEFTVQENHVFESPSHAAQTQNENLSGKWHLKWKS